MAKSKSHQDIYIEHRRELLDYATRIVGDRSRAEDVVQEAFLRFRSGATAKSLDEPLGYLRRIVRNLSIDRVRRGSTERKTFDDGFAPETAADSRPSQEMEIVAKQELDLVLRAMAELPERTRVALEMHRFEGFKLREIADHLGISVALAHSLVFDGLDHCRKRLAQGR